MRERAGRAVRTTLLAGTAMLATAAGAEPETRVGVTLTEGADVRALTGVALDVDRTPDLFGLAPDVLGFGVLALGGDDNVRLRGTASLGVRLTETRVYTELPGTEELLTAFFGPVGTAAKAVLLDGGAGNDRLTNAAAATVEARSTLDQVDFVLATPGIPFGLMPVTTTAAVSAVAEGLSDTAGTNQLRNESGLAVTAIAKADRAGIELNLIQSSSETEILAAEAVATGLAGGSGRDTLANAGVLTVGAEAEGRTARLTATGITLSEVSTETEVLALAEGLVGREGNDSLSNAALLTVTSAATVQALDLVLSLTAIADSVDGAGTSDAETQALSIANGLVGGDGRDTLTNSGTMVLGAAALHEEAGLFVDDGGIDFNALITLLAPPAIDELASGGAIARIAGLMGDGGPAVGNDVILNSGSIAGTATADSQIVSVGIGVPLNDLLGEPIEPVSTLTGYLGLSLSDVVAHANAGAVGIEGGDGADIIKNPGSITLGSTADVQASQVNLAVLDWLSDIGGGDDEPSELDISGALAVMTTGAIGRAVTSGIDGGEGDDQIGSAGRIGVTATADAQGDTVEIGFSKGDEQVSASMAAIFARTSALAQATGIDAGAGRDLVQASGAVDSFAEADTRVIGLKASLNLADKGMTLDATLLDNRAEALAVATGIAGAGDVRLLASGPIAAEADARARTFAIEGQAAVLAALGEDGTGAGLAGTAPAIVSGMGSDAIARAIDLPGSTGAAGSSTIEGPLMAEAQADLQQIGVQASIAFAQNGVALAATIIDATNSANATAGLYRGGGDGVAISGTGAHRATAEADSLAVEFQLSAGVTETGLAGAVTLMQADNSATAAARGFESGGGVDTIRIDGSALAEAMADAQSFSFSIGAAGTNTGVALGAALVSADNVAAASARLVEAGEGDDVLGGAGALMAAARADTQTVAMSAGLAGAVTGVALGGALATSTTEAAADARAVDLGDGNDMMALDGTLTSGADSTAGAVNLAIGLGASVTGIGAGVVLHDSRVGAAANALGVVAGTGDDSAVAHGGLDVAATAAAANADLSMTFGAALQGGLAGGFVMSDTTVTAQSTASGMRGGTGNDLLAAIGTATPIAVTAAAAAERTTVQLLGSFALGASVGGTLLDATTRATATAVGLAGSDLQAALPSATPLAEAAPLLRVGPPDDDRLSITGPAGVIAIAQADVVELIIDLQFAASIGASLYTADNSASATAIAMDGGIGADWLEQSGRLDVEAVAATSGPSIAVSGIASSMGDVAMAADSIALGMAGGDGNDRINQRGTLATSATSVATAEKIDIVLLGDAMGRMDARADSRATAIDGGAGDDVITTTGATSALASSNTPGYAIGISLLGQALPRAGTLGVAHATAIETGYGQDQLAAAGGIFASAAAFRAGNDVAVSLIGLTETDADNRTEAAATGIANAGGADQLLATAGLTADALAETVTEGVAVSLVGDARSSADIAARATATGVRSGAGGSLIELRQRPSVTATATTVASLIDVSLLGQVGIDASPTATARAEAVAAGDDRDTIRLDRGADVQATATSTTDAIAVQLVGRVDVDSRPSAEGVATGVAAGGGADRVNVSGGLTVGAIAGAFSEELSVNLVGSTSTPRSFDGDMAALATATGIDGGDGSDVIEGRGLASAATATLATSGFSFNLVGETDTASGNGLGRASAIGVAGGGGHDEIVTDSVSATATALGASGTTSISIVGVGAASAGNRLEGVATGIDAGAGDDRLRINRDLDAAAVATGTGSAFSLNIVGRGTADVGQSVVAAATGLATGEGNDSLTGEGDISASATAIGFGGTRGISIIGDLSSDAAVATSAAATAVDLGGGADRATSAGDLHAQATVTADAGSRSLSIIGLGTATATIGADLALMGIAAGAGRDQVAHAGDLQLDGTTTLTAGARTLSIVGEGRATTGLFARAQATGMDGGSEDDELANDSAGRIEADLAANLTATGTTLTIIGASATGAVAGSALTLLGMGGGAGDDLLVNRGFIRLAGIGRLTSTNASSSIIGQSAVGGSLESRASATGLAGGDGADTLEQQGRLTLAARSIATFDGSSYSTIGSSASGALLGSQATAIGLDGGRGADRLLLAAGSITDVLADADTRLLSEVEVVIGTARSANPAGAVAGAVGLDGGDDADRLTAAGELLVQSEARTDFSGSRIAGLGNAQVRDQVTADATATGLAGGAGDDVLEAMGTLFVQPLAEAIGFGSAGADLGDADAAAEARAVARATGLDGGVGTDSFTLSGEALVELVALARSEVEAEAGVAWSDGVGRARARTSFDGALIRDAGGNSTLSISGNQRLQIATPGVREGSFARVDGEGSGVDSNASTLAESDSQMSLRGVQLGGGTHQLTLGGRLEVLANPRQTGIARAIGGEGISNDSLAITDVAAGFDTLVGIDARPGTLGLTLAAGGSLNVAANSISRAESTAEVRDGGFPNDPNADAFAVAQNQFLEVSGLRAAFGNDNVTQRGTLTVVAAPVVTATAIGTGNGEGLAQDATANARAQANDVSAIGIALGEGANVVVNSGTMTVNAAPSVVAVASAFGYGPDGDATATALAEARRTAATGIATGGGNDRITNSGTIAVDARPVANAIAVAAPSIDCDAFCGGSSDPTQTATISSSAWAIRTGGGDDVVENSGTISASQLGAGDRFAILTEAGNDSVLLSGGRVTGAIDLGEGNDTLSISTTIVDNGVFGASGFDSLNMDGAGALPGTSGFERFQKTGAGAFAINAPWVGATQTLITAGTLRVGNLSSFGPGHLLSINVAPGGNGLLDFGPQVLPIVLTGTLGVLADPGVFSSRTWDVLRVDGNFVGGFSALTLPPNTAQLSWFAFPASSGTGRIDRYRVQLNVRPLGGMLPRGLLASFGAALDAATPGATGGLAATLGAIQRLPELADVEAVVAAMAPRLNMAAIAGAAQATDSALALLAARPAGLVGAPTLGIVGGAPAPGTGGSWAAAFDRAPTATAGTGMGQWSGFASGMELATPGGTTLGIAAVRQGSNRGLASGGGQLESTTLGVALGAPVGPGRIDLAAAAGHSRFDGARSLRDAGGATAPRLTQESRSRALSAAGRWPLADLAGPLAFSGGLDWRQEQGAGYREAGAGALGLMVEGSTATRTESRLGFSYAPEIRFGLAGPALRARLGAHWVHRFDPAGERLVGRFAGAPGTRFTLAGDAVAADSLALDAAVDLLAGRRFTLAAAGSARVGDAAADRRADIRLTLPF